jgi:hypothetical protein
VGRRRALRCQTGQRMLVNFEYAQGVEENRGVYLKFGYGW